MTPYLDQSNVAHVVFGVSIAVLAVTELLLTLRVRRGTHADFWSEVVFRVVFFAAVLVLPIGRQLAPSARIGGGAVVG